MANTTYKVLGQALTASTANADLYTVPASTEVIVSTLTISNVTATAATARVFIRVAGAAAATSNAILYDVSIPCNSVQAFTLGITLAATDKITVQNGTSSALTFQAFGAELASWELASIRILSRLGIKPLLHLALHTQFQQALLISM